MYNCCSHAHAHAPGLLFDCHRPPPGAGAAASNLGYLNICQRYRPKVPVHGDRAATIPRPWQTPLDQFVALLCSSASPASEPAATCPSFAALHVCAETARPRSLVRRPCRRRPHLRHVWAAAVHAHAHSRLAEARRAPPSPSARPPETLLRDEHGAYRRAHGRAGRLAPAQVLGQAGDSVHPPGGGCRST